MINDQKKVPEGKEDVIELREEQISIRKNQVLTGNISIKKTTETEEVTNEVSLFREDISIEHVIVNEQVEAMPQVREEGNTTIIPIVREVAVVTKKLVLVKEIRITKNRVESTERIKTHIRSEKAEVIQDSE